MADYFFENMVECYKTVLEKQLLNHSTNTNTDSSDTLILFEACKKEWTLGDLQYKANNRCICSRSSCFLYKIYNFHTNVLFSVDKYCLQHIFDVKNKEFKDELSKNMDQYLNDSKLIVIHNKLQTTGYHVKPTVIYTNSKFSVIKVTNKRLLELLYFYDEYYYWKCKITHNNNEDTFKSPFKFVKNTQFTLKILAPLKKNTCEILLLLDNPIMYNEIYEYTFKCKDVVEETVKSNCVL